MATLHEETGNRQGPISQIENDSDQAAKKKWEGLDPVENDGRFHCRAECHLAKLSHAAWLLHPMSLSLRDDKGHFRISAQTAANHLRLSLRSVQRGYEDLKKSGFWVLVESGKSRREPSIFKPLIHSEWATLNPGKCSEKLTFPWTGEPTDELRKALNLATDHRVPFPLYLVRSYQGNGLTNEEVLERFKHWFARNQDQPGKRWRQSVAKDFGAHLRRVVEG